MIKNPPLTPQVGELEIAIKHANELAHAGEFQKAVNHCLQSLLEFGEQAGFLKILGSIAFNQKNIAHAIEFYERATKASPADALSWAGLGMAYGVDDQTTKAIVALRNCVDLKPQTPVPYLNLAMAMMKAQKFTGALDVLKPASELFPDFLPFRIWLGHCYSSLDQGGEARGIYKQIATQNSDDLSVLLPLALLERDRGEIEESSKCLEKILQHQPDHPVANFTYAQNLLISGDLKAGFARYENRWDRDGMIRPNLKSPLWRGEGLAGKKILVYAEQGFGDAIQFVRYLTQLKAMGATVQLKAHPRLHKILSTLGQIDQFITKDEEEDADYNIAMMSLPHYLNTTIDTIPNDIPYLRANERLVERWCGRLNELGGDAKLKVGLVWQGDPNSQSEKGRSVPFENLKMLFDIKNIHFFLIQKQDGLNQLQDIVLPENVSDLGPELDLGADAFVDTASVMTCLDIVISSDTSPAHLAGALGCKTWVMLKYIPEWRWLLGRDDSPWYPTAILFRQHETGNWAEVIQKIKSLLNEQCQ